MQVYFREGFAETAAHVIFFQINVKTGMIIYLKQIAVQMLVRKQIKAHDLEEFWRLVDLLLFVESLSYLKAMFNQWPIYW